MSFDLYALRMGISNMAEARLHYANYLCDSCNLFDAATSEVNRAIADTTQPCGFLESAYRTKLKALRYAQRFEECLKSADELCKAFDSDLTTRTWYRVVVKNSDTVKQLSTIEKSFAYEGMGQLEKAMEYRKACDSGYSELLRAVPENQAKPLRLVLMDGECLGQAKLYEKMGRYEDALACLERLKTYYADPTNFEGIADPDHSNEEGLLTSSRRIREQRLPEAIERLQKVISEQANK